MAHPVAHPVARKGPPLSTVTVPSMPYNHSVSDPLPSQVADEQNALRAAVQLSANESQQRRSNQDRINNEFERQYQRAVSESQIEYGAVSRSRSSNGDDEDSELTESVTGQDREEYAVKMAYAKSIADEEHRQRMTDREYEDALMLAIEQSNQEEMQNNAKKSAEEDDDLIMQKALEESKALAEAQQAKTCEEDDILEKILAESKLEEERRKEEPDEEELIQKALAESKALAEAKGATNGKSMEYVDVLQEVMELSLQEINEEAMAEEEAIKRAIEMSKHIH